MKKLFTLIELLVVIAVIAILASMLLPSLNSAREVAKKIQCLGILKQYTSAALMYSGEFNDYWLPIHNSPVSGGVTWYRNQVYRTMLGGQMTAASVDNKLDAGTINIGLICPNARMSLLNPVGKLYPIERSYGMSADDMAAWNNGEKITAHKLSRIVRPSERMSFCDGRDWALYYSGADPAKYRAFGELTPPVDPANCYTAYRHGKNMYANVGFFDGHANTLDYNDLWKRYRFFGFYSLNNF